MKLLAGQNDRKRRKYIEELDEINEKIKKKAEVRNMREQHNLKFVKGIQEEFFDEKDFIYITLLSRVGGEVKFRAEFPAKDQQA